MLQTAFAVYTFNDQSRFSKEHSFACQIFKFNYFSDILFLLMSNGEIFFFWKTKMGAWEFMDVLGTSDFMTPGGCV